MAIDKPIWVLNGPNLNRLGQRPAGHYGAESLADLEARLHAAADRLGITVVCRQSNHEGQLVDWVHAADADASALVINAGAYTHTSIALHDALETVSIPAIEVHLSNIQAREPFRHRSFVTPQAVGIIAGLGPLGYELAIQGLHALLRARDETPQDPGDPQE